jgi:hypothetical protein
VNDQSVDRRRRRLIAGATTAALFGIAGCTDDPEEEDEQNGSLEDEGDRPADEDEEDEEDVEDEGGEAEETSLRVTVETEDGDLVDGASVAIEGDEFEDEVETEPDGVALFSNIEPGQYSIEASAEGYGTAEEGVELEEGENEEIEVTLPPEGEEAGQEEQNEEAEDDAL